ncbi:MAG: hypothetical protein H6719_25310 [Sandaracinaceae bacterium]|nr:hypothetical protein [Sandaracinaceae bacterium]
MVACVAAGIGAGLFALDQLQIWALVFVLTYAIIGLGLGFGVYRFGALPLLRRQLARRVERLAEEHRVLRVVCGDLLRRLGIEGAADASPHELRGRAGHLARQAARLARHDSSWVELRAFEPTIVLMDWRADDDETEYLELAARHHALSAAIDIARMDETDVELADPRSLDKAVCVWARASGASATAERRGLCAAVAKELPWSVIEARAADLPGPDAVDGMAFAQRARSVAGLS